MTTERKPSDDTIATRVIFAFALITLLVIVAARHVFAADATDYNYIDGESSPSLVDEQSRAAAAALLGAEQGAALLHALDLQMQKYDRDMTTRSGRESWHGQLVAQEIYTNDLAKVEVYSNEVTGATWRYRTSFKPVSPVSPTKATVTYATNGIPARLAAARAARAAEINAGTIVTNIVVTAGATNATATGTIVEPVTGDIDESTDPTEADIEED